MQDHGERPVNHVLARLSQADLDSIKPLLAPVELEFRRKLLTPNQLIDFVYFVESGLVSVVGGVRDDLPVEIGVIGREGVANLPVLMGSERSRNATIVQVAGHTLRMRAECAEEAMVAMPSFNKAVRECASLFMMQTSATAVANARATISQRLARWLLIARDHLDDDMIPLTHELLSYMIGVRRPAVSLAMAKFEQSGWVAGERGRIRLLDTAALMLEANGFYEGPAGRPVAL